MLLIYKYVHTKTYISDELLYREATSLEGTYVSVIYICQVNEFQIELVTDCVNTECV